MASNYPKMEFETVLRFHLILVRIAKMNKANGKQMLVRCGQRENTGSLLLGL